MARYSEKDYKDIGIKKRVSLNEVYKDEIYGKSEEDITDNYNKKEQIDIEDIYYSNKKNHLYWVPHVGIVYVIIGSLSPLFEANRALNKVFFVLTIIITLFMMIFLKAYRKILPMSVKQFLIFYFGSWLLSIPLSIAFSFLGAYIDVPSLVMLIPFFSLRHEMKQYKEFTK